MLIAGSADDEHVVLDEVRRLGLEVTLVRNRHELMVLPAGVTKGTGLVSALSALGRSRHDTIAVGDTENDHSLLDVAEIGVAVANAVPSLKAQADVVLEERDGAGIIELCDQGVVDRQSPVHPARSHIVLGVTDRGAPVTVPSSMVNILIAGSSGGGKSFLTGMVAELLIESGYGALIVDPEGDHVGLSSLPDVTLVGGGGYLPSPHGLAQSFVGDHGVVVDLSHLDADQQVAYLAALPAELELQRQRTGMPHWIILDEAQRTTGRHGPAGCEYDTTSKGHCLATWRPEQLSPDAVLATDIVLAVASEHPSDGSHVWSRRSRD